MLDIRKRTGWLFFWVMMAQIILVSAQVQTRTGTRVLQAAAFEVFSRIQHGTASVVNGTRGLWTNYVALRHVRGDPQFARFEFERRLIGRPGSRRRRRRRPHP